MAGDVFGDGIDGDCDGLDCEAGWLDTTYFAACPDAGRTWDEARDLCQEGYDDLAVVRSESEQVFIADLIQTGPQVPMWNGFSLQFDVCRTKV